MPFFSSCLNTILYVEFGIFQNSVKTKLF